MKDGYGFSLAARGFEQIDLQKYSGLLTPRKFFSYSADNVPGVTIKDFEDSIDNSFPDLATKIRFINKLYQCVLGRGIPLKCKKLLVYGEQDSGKTTWAYILKGLTPERHIASLSKSSTFALQQIDEQTLLIFINEWSQNVMDEDELKRLLEGIVLN